MTKSTLWIHRSVAIYNLVLGLIALIAVAVGLPQIITAWQGRKLREQTEKYEELKQEIEMLKQERIVRP